MTFHLFFKSSFLLTWILICPAFGCASLLNAQSVPGEIDEGYAVYYADSLDGHQTASGELYDKNSLSAAHRKLPFGTTVRVINLNNRRQVLVRINDRGPFSKRRNIIDVSRSAAEHIDMIKDGIVPVRVEIVSLAPPKK
jgi:rare lipoprotein A